MAGKSFLEAGVNVEIRRLDERGDSLYAVVQKASGDAVPLAWKGTPPQRAPATGSMVRVIRTAENGRQRAIKALIQRIDAKAITVVARSKPSSYDKRTFLRVEGDLAIAFKVIPPEEVEDLKLEIESVRVGSSKRAPAMSPVPSRGGSRGKGSIPAQVSARLDRIEEKLDQLLAILDKTKPTVVGAREICRTDISGSGIRFLHSSTVAKSAAIDMEIELPLQPTVVIRVLVEVLRCDPNPKGRNWIAGRYLAIHEQHQGEIVRYSFERQRLEKKKADKIS